jgi:hypothetical protein
MRLALVLLLSAALAPPQDDAALKDRVEQLVAKLGAEDAGARDEAEKALVGLGARALPLLPTVAPEASDDDAKARFTRIRRSIESAQEDAALVASRATIKGQGLRLTDVLRDLQRQTGNRITDLREVYGAEATNPAMDLDVEGMPFFEALDLIAKKAEVAPEFFTGDGSVGLMPGGGTMYARPGEEDGTSAPLIQYAGPFRVEFVRLAATREMSTGQGRANAQFNVAWEPRLRPMLLTLKADKVEIVDDRGNPVEPEVEGESGNVVLRPENPVVEVNLNMRAPDRAAQSLRSLTVRADVTVPAGLRQFRFDDLDAAGKEVTQGDIRLTLVSTDVEDNIWNVRIKLSMPAGGEAFDSYQQGLFNNRIWLQRADGSRFEHNGGFNFLNAGPGELAFEYLFVDAPGKPGDYSLIYETPSRVVTIPLEFTFRDVPLP